MINDILCCTHTTEESSTAGLCSLTIDLTRRPLLYETLTQISFQNLESPNPVHVGPVQYQKRFNTAPSTFQRVSFFWYCHLLWVSIIVRFSFRGARQFDDKCRKFPAYLQLSREGNSRRVVFELYRMYTEREVVLWWFLKWSLFGGAFDLQEMIKRMQHWESRRCFQTYAFLTFKLHYLIREVNFGGKRIHLERKAKGFNAFIFWP